MPHPLTSKKKAQALASTLFLFGLAVVSYIGSWWPGIMLAIGLPLAIRQYLLGRFYDMGITLFAFVGIFVTAQFDISWEVLLPILFSLAGIYIFLRDFIEETPLDEEEEDLNQELEEEEKH